MTGGECLFAPVEQHNVIESGGNQHHGLSGEQIRTAVLEAGELRTCHGMAAHKGKAVLLRQRETAVADFPLDAAKIHYQCVFADVFCIFLQPCGAAVGVDSKKNQITGGNRNFIQLTVNGACQHSKLQHLFVFFAGQYGVTFQGVGTCHGAADETKSQNTNGHTIASRTLRMRWFSSSN